MDKEDFIYEAINHAFTKMVSAEDIATYLNDEYPDLLGEGNKVTSGWVSLYARNLLDAGKIDRDDDWNYCLSQGETHTTFRLSEICDHCSKRGPVEVTYTVRDGEVTEESALCKNCQDK